MVCIVRLMGQATSMVRGRSLEVARVVSVTWPQFVDMVCDLNTRTANDKTSVSVHFDYAVQSAANILLAFLSELESKNVAATQCVSQIEFCNINALLDVLPLRSGHKCTQIISRNASNTTESCRVLTLAQFLSLQKSLYALLNNMEPESCSSAVDLSRELCTSEYLNSIGAQSECIICMERAPDTILPCAHSYCLVCIEQWKAYGKSLCPICREPLEVDGNDEWVIPEEPDDDAVRQYLMSLADPCSQPSTAR